MKHLEELSMTELYAGYQKYERLRKLNPRQFHDLYKFCLKNNYRFDFIVDQLPGILDEIKAEN